jgi:hypothetical protein
VTNRTALAAMMGLVWALALTALVAAHQPGTAGSQQKVQSRQPGGDMKSMQDMMNMMQECRKNQQKAISAIDWVSAMLEAAKQASDPPQTRAALDQAQQPLAEVKDRMVMYTNAMERMQAMHGGMGGRMQGMQGMMQSGPGSTREGAPPSDRPQ